MLLVASETGHVYTFATRKLQPMITSESGKWTHEVGVDILNTDCVRVRQALNIGSGAPGLFSSCCQPDTRVHLAGKALIQTCLNSPDAPPATAAHNLDQRMNPTGFEEPELTYSISEDEQAKVSAAHRVPFHVSE